MGFFRIFAGSANRFYAELPKFSSAHNLTRFARSERALGTTFLKAYLTQRILPGIFFFLRRRRKFLSHNFKIILKKEPSCAAGENFRSDKDKSVQNQSYANLGRRIFTTFRLNSQKFGELARF